MTVDWVYMRFCKTLAVVLFGLLGFWGAAAAHAQAGVYIGYQATRLSGITCFEPAPLQCSSTGGKVNPAGFQAGAYYDFHNFGPMRFGVDFRGGTMHSNKSATSSAGGSDSTVLDNALLGVRGSFRTPISWLSPYVQVSAGYGRSNATLPFGASLTTTTPLPRLEDSYIMYEGFAGLTIHIFPMLDLRPIEVGIGNMNRIGNSGATIDGPSSVGVLSIGGSVVFHLPSSR
jgi:hypothetical protein